MSIWSTWRSARHANARTGRAKGRRERGTDIPTIEQYEMWGDPTKGDTYVQQTKTIRREHVHPLTDLTGSIYSVMAEFRGNGEILLVVRGYDEAEVRETWLASAETFAGMSLRSEGVYDQAAEQRRWEDELLSANEMTVAGVWPPTANTSPIPLILLPGKGEE